MASKPLSWLALVLVALVASLGLIGILLLFQPTRSEPPGIEAICLDRGAIGRIRARLLANEDLRQAESDYQDLSPFLDLTLDLICPCERSPMQQSRYPAVCELLVETKTGSSRNLTVVWPGSGAFLIGDGHRYCFARIGRYYPVGIDKYVDESAAFCGLVQSMIAKDDQRTEHFAAMLRNSLGYNRDKNSAK